MNETTKPKLLGNYKAIQSGHRGTQLTLPSAYCKLNDIEPGTEMELFMYEHDSSILVIRPRKATT